MKNIYEGNILNKLSMKFEHKLAVCENMITLKNLKMIELHLFSNMTALMILKIFSLKMRNNALRLIAEYISCISRFLRPIWFCVGFFFFFIKINGTYRFLNDYNLSNNR